MRIRVQADGALLDLFCCSPCSSRTFADQFTSLGWGYMVAFRRHHSALPVPPTGTWASSRKAERPSRSARERGLSSFLGKISSGNSSSTLAASAGASCGRSSTLSTGAQEPSLTAWRRQMGPQTMVCATRSGLAASGSSLGARSARRLRSDQDDGAAIKLGRAFEKLFRL